MDIEIYNPKDRKRIKAIQDKIQKLGSQIEELKEQIVEIQIGTSPIKAGDHVVWERGSGRLYRGLVISVSTEWRTQYRYRIQILSKGNKPCGFANVLSGTGICLESAAQEMFPK